MRIPYELIDSKWREPLQNLVSPPLNSVDDLLLRDNFHLLRQIKCSIDDILSIKRQVLDTSSHQLPKKRRLTYPAAQQSSQSLLSTFYPVFLPKDANSNTPSMPISTGFIPVDSLFHGGVPRGQVTCLAGDASSGRTQLCLHTALSAALNQQVKVLYIDSNTQVAPQRLHSMLSSMLLSQDVQQEGNYRRRTEEEQSERMAQTLARIDIRHCFSLFDAFDTLSELIESQRSNNTNNSAYDLIIVDSLYHWIAPLLSDLHEKFPATGTTTTAISQRQSFSSSAGLSAGISSSTSINIHPLIAKLGLLLRALASTTTAYCTASTLAAENPPKSTAVLVTTFSTWFLPMFGTGTEATGSGVATSTHSFHRHFAAYWRDIFDTIIKVQNLSAPTILPPTSNIPGTLWKVKDTTVSLRILYRPPYFKAQPETARFVLPAASSKS